MVGDRRHSRQCHQHKSSVKVPVAGLHQGRPWIVAIGYGGVRCGLQDHPVTEIPRFNDGRHHRLGCRPFNSPHDIIFDHLRLGK